MSKNLMKQKEYVPYKLRRILMGVFIYHFFVLLLFIIFFLQDPLIMILQTNSFWLYFTITFILTVFIVFRVYTSKTEALRDFSDSLKSENDKIIAEQISEITEKIAQEKNVIREIEKVLKSYKTQMITVVESVL